MRVSLLWAGFALPMCVSRVSKNTLRSDLANERGLQITPSGRPTAGPNDLNAASGVEGSLSVAPATTAKNAAIEDVRPPVTHYDHDVPEQEQILLSASQMLVSHGSFVTIGYAAQAPRSLEEAGGDYLLFYSPSTADPLKTVPFRIARAADDQAYPLTGRGSRRIKLAGPRSDVAVYFARGMSVSDNWYRWMTGRKQQDLLFGGRIASRPLVLDFADRGAPLWPRVLPATSGESADGDALRIAWQGDPSPDQQPVVQWGEVRGQFTGQAQGVRHEYGRSDMCPDVLGWIDPRGDGNPHTLTSAATGAGFAAAAGVTYSAVITGLRRYAGRTVYYRVGNSARPDSAGMSAPFSLKVPAPPGDVSAPFTLLAGADWGAAPGDDSVAYKPYSDRARNVSLRMAAEVAAGSAQGVVLGGDLAYSDGMLPMWDVWLEQTTGFASRVPVFVADGNHESGWPLALGDDSALFPDVIASGGECGAPLAALYPQPPPWSARTPWSSARLGPACLFSVSTEHDFTTGSPQWRWLNATLAQFWGAGSSGGGGVAGTGSSSDGAGSSISGTKPACPWIIGVAHRPMYVDSKDDASPSHDLPVMHAMQTHLDPLFKRYRVNLVLSGHNHRYERNCPVDLALGACEMRGRPTILPDGRQADLYNNPRNSLHLVVGSSGADFDTDKTGQWWIDRQVLQVSGYARVMMLNGSHLEVEWVDAAQPVTAGSGRVLDRFVVTQQWPRLTPEPAVADASAGGESGSPVDADIIHNDDVVVLSSGSRSSTPPPTPSPSSGMMVPDVDAPIVVVVPSSAIVTSGSATPVVTATCSRSRAPSASRSALATPGPPSPSPSPSTVTAAFEDENDDRIVPPSEQQQREESNDISLSGADSKNDGVNDNDEQFDDSNRDSNQDDQNSSDVADSEGSSSSHDEEGSAEPVGTKDESQQAEDHGVHSDIDRESSSGGDSSSTATNNWVAPDPGPLPSPSASNSPGRPGDDAPGEALGVLRSVDPLDAILGPDPPAGSTSSTGTTGKGTGGGLRVVEGAGLPESPSGSGSDDNSGTGSSSGGGSGLGSSKLFMFAFVLTASIVLYGGLGGKRPQRQTRSGSSAHYPSRLATMRPALQVASPLGSERDRMLQSAHSLGSPSKPPSSGGGGSGAPMVA